MTEPLAFLSYTRKDDEFFGGYISAFRKMLENAVHVTSGEESFRIFQDVEGIVIGENWKKKLSDVIQDASFFVPMISPLFFNSKPCREEVDAFLAHEQSLGRDDLLLPIYFLSSAKLEKDEERDKDPIATEVASRQIFDWREKAKIPLQENASRIAVLELAGQIVVAIERLGRSGSTDGLKPTPMPPTLALRSPGTDTRLDAGVNVNAKRQELSELHVLWVDDNPDNNLWERRALESYGLRITPARDTEEAKRLLCGRNEFAAIISDMGRPGDTSAGYTLLHWLREDPKRTQPYFIYTSVRVANRHSDSSIPRLHGITADPDALVEMIVNAVR